MRGFRVSGFGSRKGGRGEGEGTPGEREALEQALRSARAEVEVPPYLAARVVEAARGAKQRKRVNWRLAAAVGAVVVLLPLAGTVVWKQGRGRFHNPPALAERTWQVEVTTPEGRGIRTVRYVLRKRTATRILRAGSTGQWQREPEETVDCAFEYPDKSRIEPSPVPGRVPSRDTASVRNGDRAFAYLEGGWKLTGPRVYHYVLSRPVAPLDSPDMFGEGGVVSTGLVAAEGGYAYPYRLGDAAGGEDVLTRHWESSAHGERVLVTEHTKTGDPSFHGVYRTRLDPASHLVLGWSNVTVQRIKASGPQGPETAEERYEETVDAVEYNADLPPGTFTVTVPASADPADVFDGYSPEGLKQTYEASLVAMAVGLSRSPALKPDVRENALRVWSTQFPRLEVLSPADREEIRSKGRAIGLRIP